MKGAREFATLFKTGQYGRLYIVSGHHSRGRTFEIYILPKDEVAVYNGEQYPPQNESKVRVYGMVSGHPGWDETYDWIHEGKWKDDFLKMVEERKQELEEQKNRFNESVAAQIKEREERARRLLEDY